MKKICSYWKVTVKFFRTEGFNHLPPTYIKMGNSHIWQEPNFPISLELFLKVIKSQNRIFEWVNSVTKTLLLPTVARQHFSEW